MVLFHLHHISKRAYVLWQTTISVPHHTAYQSPTNFTSPTTFAPERWLSSPEKHAGAFDGDNKKAFNPFSTGPRNCLGKNLAYHEMRLILAKLIWHFDFGLADEQAGEDDWLDQRVLTFWEKRPLRVKISKSKG